MSVVGSLQIIHVSRSSGILILTTRDGERRVHFVDGLVRESAAPHSTRSVSHV